jgi:hypothetical protein
MGGIDIAAPLPLLCNAMVLTGCWNQVQLKLFSNLTPDPEHHSGS